jgi:hypothetical protein
MSAADRSEYMRAYRAKHLAKKRRYDRRYRKLNHAKVLAWHRRRAAQARVRAKAYYYANQERVKARVKAYMAAHPDEHAVWRRRSKMRAMIACPFCNGKMHKTSISCPDCQRKYGCWCKHNVNCGIQGRHKHCPRCSMPIRNPKSKPRTIEECAWCLADAARGAHMDCRSLGVDDEEIAA